MAGTEIKSRLLICAIRQTMALPRTLARTGGGWIWNGKRQSATYLQIYFHLSSPWIYPRRLTCMKYRFSCPLASSWAQPIVRRWGNVFPWIPLWGPTLGWLFPWTEYHCFCQCGFFYKNLSFWIPETFPFPFRSGSIKDSAVTSLEFWITSCGFPTTTYTYVRTP